jgi:hypothetical protein
LGVIRRRRSREKQDRDSQKGRVNGDLEAVAVDGEHVEVGTGVSMATSRAAVVDAVVMGRERDQMRLIRGCRACF